MICKFNVMKRDKVAQIVLIEVAKEILTEMVRIEETVNMKHTSEEISHFVYLYTICSRYSLKKTKQCSNLLAFFKTGDQL